MFTFGTRAQCRRGTIVLLRTGEYLLIKEVRRDGERQNQWVYDGTVLDISQPGRLRTSGGISGVLQSNVAEIVAN